MSNEGLNLSEFAASGADFRPSNGSRCGPGLPAIKKGEPYLGIIPIDWLRGAIQAGRTGRRPRKTTETTLAIWFRARCSRSGTVQLSRKDLHLFCLNRWAYYRSLTALEKAALIKVRRPSGKRVEVTILPVSDDERIEE